MKTPKNVLIDNVAIRRRIAGSHDVELTSAETNRAVRILHRRGLTDSQIGEALGMSVHAIYKRRFNMGLPSVVPIGHNRLVVA